VGQFVLHAQPDTPHVQIERFVELLGCGLRPVEFGPKSAAGIVEGTVKTTESGERELDISFDLVLDSDISLDELDLCPVALQFIHKPDRFIFAP